MAKYVHRYRDRAIGHEGYSASDTIVDSSTLGPQGDQGVVDSTSKGGGCLRIHSLEQEWRYEFSNALDVYLAGSDV